MKTITQLVREFLTSRKKEASKVHENRPAGDPQQRVESDNKPKLQTKKDEANETENHEVSGDPDLDHPGGEETDLPAQGESGEQGERRGKLGKLQSYESYERGTPTCERGESIEEAYERGLIDGRNSEIERRYFPKDDDGIPRFRGCPKRPSPVSDIFSMAREA